MTIQLNHVSRANSTPSGKRTIDSEAAAILRRLATRLTLRANQRVTYRDAMDIVESGLDDATLDILIARYYAANSGHGG
jgi:hypothetical protein